jgi:hypothetical protein
MVGIQLDCPDGEAELRDFSAEVVDCPLLGRQVEECSRTAVS